MKKFLKKTVLLWAVVCIIAAVCAVVAIASYMQPKAMTAYAEGEEEKTYVITESDLTNFLLSLSEEEEWQEVIKSELVQNIITFIFSLIASVFALLMVYRSLKNNNMQLKAQIKRCADGDESVEKATKGLIDSKEQIEKIAEKINKKMDIFSERQKQMEEEIKIMNEGYVVEERKIVQMLKTAFLNDPQLVKSGYAKVIKEISEADDEIKEKGKES